MAEYIEREAAANIFEAPMWRGYSEPYTFEAHLAMVAVAKLIREEIGKIPAADVAPVRHGRWVEKEKYTFGIMYDCSLCENRILDNGHSWNYCPNCGAKMGADTQEREGV